MSSSDVEETFFVREVADHIGPDGATHRDISIVCWFFATLIDYQQTN